MEFFGNIERLVDDIYPYRWLIAALAAVGLILLATAAYRYNWHRAILRHKLRTTLIVVPLLVVAVPVSYYLLSPLWTRTTIHEESPLANAGITVAGIPAPTRTPTPVTMDVMTETATSTATTQPTPTTAPEPVAANSEPAPTEAETQPPTTEPEPEPTAEPVIEPTLEPAPEPTPEPEPTLEPVPEPEVEPTVEPAPDVFAPRLVSSGSLSGADEFHFASGTALLIETEPGIYVLRLEEFSVRNGPDLFVYLAASPEYLDEGAINLGDLRATDGSINYDIPPGTDISQFQGVVIWCRAFAVFFGSAPLFPV